MEFKAVLAEELGESFTVEVIQVQDAQLTLHVPHVVHDRMGLRLMDREFIIVHAEFIYRFNKGFYGK